MLEAKRDTMEAEHKSLGAPQEEREKLFKQVSFTTEEWLDKDMQRKSYCDYFGRYCDCNMIDDF